MATPKQRSRPLSPHLGVYRWGPHMLVSIVHRATGSGMATVGALLLIWWLAALAGGEDSYTQFRALFTYASGGINPLGYLVGVALTFALFQHMASGVRHLFMDIGAWFELKTNKVTALATYLVSLTATLAFWAAIWGKIHG